jgi:PAS domain-containing protein
MPASAWAGDPLTFWRERILFIICFLVSTLGVVVLIPSITLAFLEGLWTVVVLDTAAYLFQLIDTLVPLAIALMLNDLKKALSKEQETSASMRESQSRYRTLAKNFPNGALCLIDHDFRFLAADGQELQKHRLSSDRLIGRTVDQVMPEIAGIIRTECARVFQGIITVARDGAIIDVNSAFVEILGAPSRQAVLEANAFRSPHIQLTRFPDQLKDCMDHGSSGAHETSFTSSWNTSVYLRCATC